MSAKLSEQQIFLRRVVKTISGLQAETAGKVPKSDGKTPIPEITQWEALNSALKTALYHSKLLLKYVDTEDVVYMIEGQDGTIRKASRQQVFKILSKHDDMMEVLPE